MLKAFRNGQHGRAGKFGGRADFLVFFFVKEISYKTIHPSIHEIYHGRMDILFPIYLRVQIKIVDPVDFERDKFRIFGIGTGKWIR